MDNTQETFEQKLARTKGVDQDFVATIVDNWQRVLGSFLAVLLGVWVFGEYKSANESKVGEASKRFDLVQETLVKVRTDKANAEHDTKLLADNLTALKTTFDGTSYNDFAPLYEAASLHAQGKLDQAQVKYREVIQANNSKEFDRKDLVNELANLGLARVLLDEQKDAEAIKLFEDLVKNSKIVNVEALLAIARISEDKANIENLAKQLKVARPEFAEQIDRELVKYGLNLAN